MDYIELCKQAEACRECPNMAFGRTFLNYHNGPSSADIMFIGESTNVGKDSQLAKPMWDSPSGDNLNALLKSCGLKREEIFITNTVLHTPIESDGSVRYVTDEEQMNCSRFLEDQISIIDPCIICTLGNRALEGFSIVEPHKVKLRYDVGKVFPISNNRWLIPLYHPSPQVIMSWRKMSQQIEDYKIIPTVLNLIKKQENNNGS